jgi:signal transduction histidine kinase
LALLVAIAVDVVPEIGNEDWVTCRCRGPFRGSSWMSPMPRDRWLGGDFSARAPLLQHVPQEFRQLALDFNEMTARLQSYEREVRDSSAILAHELRTPLNAAMDRLQGMIDGVFPVDQEQLQTVMRRLSLLPDALPRSLDRFWHAETARSRHTAGSGLGLSIASAISAAHGGSVSVMNRDGGGAIIRITLPVRISAAATG